MRTGDFTVSNGELHHQRIIMQCIDISGVLLEKSDIEVKFWFSMPIFRYDKDGSAITMLMCQTMRGLSLSEFRSSCGQVSVGLLLRVLWRILLRLIMRLLMVFAFAFDLDFFLFLAYFCFGGSGVTFPLVNSAISAS